MSYRQLQTMLLPNSTLSLFQKFLDSADTRASIDTA